MSYIVKDKFIYLAHPRTGSTATERALAAIYKSKGGIRTRPHHIGVAQCGREYVGQVTGNEFIFTTNRNPLDLIVSWWVCTPQQMSFIEFIRRYEHSDLDHQEDLFYFNYQCDKILCYEVLQSEINRLFESESWIKPSLVITNKTVDKKPFMSYHTWNSFQAMWERWPNDMSNYHENDKEYYESLVR